LADNPQSSLFERAAAEGTPLIDGQTATFVWAGETAPQLMGDFTAWDNDPRAELFETEAGVWACTLEFPEDAYLEYIFVDDEEWVYDPFNPHRVSNGFGKPNQYFYMSGAQPTPLIRRPPASARGRVTRHDLETGGFLDGHTRSVYLYQPPVEQPVPLVVVWDGQDYLRRAQLPTLLDNLIVQRRIQPLALALVENAGDNRFVEYSCSESTLIFLARGLLPFARDQLNLLDPQDHPGAFGVLGASLGGLMALYTGLRMPEIFGRVLSQSGAFSIPGHEFGVFPLVEHAPRAPLQVWMDCGIFEYLIETNRCMADLLSKRGYPLTYRECSSGHNYTAWRNDVWRGLEILYGEHPQG